MDNLDSVKHQNMVCKSVCSGIGKLHVANIYYHAVNAVN